VTRSEQLRVRCGGARQQPEAQGTRPTAAEHLGQSWLDLVVTHHQVVAWPGIERDPSMAEVRVDDTGLVLPVIIDPQLDLRLLHARHRTDSPRSLMGWIRTSQTWRGCTGASTGLAITPPE
jgi:hypothetical protein